MKQFILTALISVSVAAFSALAAGHYYRQQTYEDFISEKCWLNKQSRDIECIHYIAK